MTGPNSCDPVATAGRRKVCRQDQNKRDSDAGRDAVSRSISRIYLFGKRRMKMIRIGLSALALIGCDSVLAQQPVADIGIEVSVEPVGVTPPGTEISITVTLTNLGMDTSSALFVWTRTSNGTELSFPPLQRTGDDTGPCVNASPGQPPPPGVIFFPRQAIRDIPPGEGRTCTFDFRVLETTTLAQISRWTAFPASGSVPLDDPNDANNVADVLLLFAEPPDPVAVPALSARAMIMLGFLLGVVGFAGLWKSSIR